jgi:nitroreductase
MEIKEAIQKRYSCRKYKDIPVPDEKLRVILEAARLAPSAGNRQPYKFIVVKDKEKREKLAQIAEQSFISQAPIIIAGVSLDPERIMKCEVPTYAVDVAIAMEHIALMACAEGLATCWIGHFSQKEAKKILGIDEKYKIVALMPLGYPADSYKPKERKSLDELVYYQ